MIEYTGVKAMAEWCKGNIPASDSVVLGSNPGSAAKENRPSSEGLFSFVWHRYLSILTKCCDHVATLVRIHHSEIDKLACQAESV